MEPLIWIEPSECETTLTICLSLWWLWKKHSFMYSEKGALILKLALSHAPYNQKWAPSPKEMHAGSFSLHWGVTCVMSPQMWQNSKIFSSLNCSHTGLISGEVFFKDLPTGKDLVTCDFSFFIDFTK